MIPVSCDIWYIYECCVIGVIRYYMNEMTVGVMIVRVYF